RAQSGCRRARRIRRRDLSDRQALSAFVEAEPAELSYLSCRPRTTDDEARGKNLRRRFYQHGHAGKSQRNRRASARGGSGGGSGSRQNVHHWPEPRVVQAGQEISIRKAAPRTALL